MTLHRIEDWDRILGPVKTGGIDLSGLGNKHRAQNFNWNHVHSPEEVKEILSYIDPSCDYDTWLKVTMGVKFLDISLTLFGCFRITNCSGYAHDTG